MRPIRVCAVLLIAALLAQPAHACGPEYDDAHRGHNDYLSSGNLEEFYYSLYYPGDTLAARRKRGEAAYAKAGESEGRRDFAGALVQYRVALQELNGLGIRPVSYGSLTEPSPVRKIQDRVELLGSLKGGENPEEIVAYLKAAADGEVEVLKRIENAGTFLSDNAAYALALIEFEKSNFGTAIELFDGFARRFPDSEKRDAAAYRAARGRLAAAWANPVHQDREIDDALRGFDRYLGGCPQGAYRAEALGWQAFLLYRHDVYLPSRRAWSSAADAIRIYLRILDDAALHSMFVPAVQSLRFAYRKVRKNPPNEVMESPKHAAAFIWHAATDFLGPWPRKEDDPSQMAGILEMARKHASAFAALDLPGDLIAGLAQAFYLAGEKDTARKFADQAMAGRRPALAICIAARLEIDRGNLRAAEALFAELAEKHGEFLGRFDLGLCIGAAYEQAGDMKNALKCYLLTGSRDDVDILTDGEIAVDDFKAFVDASPGVKPPEVVWKGWGYRETVGWPGESKDDAVTYLRERLAVRLARAGRCAEALGYLDPAGGRAQTVRELIELEGKLNKAAAGDRPAALYAVAALWYHRGERIAFNGCYWHQFYCDDRLSAAKAKGADLPQAERAAWARREENMISMSKYQRALPLFLAIVEKYPQSPEAPKALYSAALCLYWMCGDNRMGYSKYWERRGREEKWRGEGNALMRRIGREYPDHPLAKSEWVTGVGGGEKR
ncbi:MAG: hypothetical protein HZA54_09525 [Planctomycetes bacterium]|nr:hypothetical protein [Planctomycetota bacterium]